MNTRRKHQFGAEAQKANRHAVVLGGSLAGLLTARVYRYPETVGGSPSRMTKFMHRHMDQVVQLATQSFAVRKVLLQAFNMLVRPTAQFQPRVLFRVLAQVLKPVRRNEARPCLTLKPATEREAS